jgi:hypothetical protein
VSSVDFLSAFKLKKSARNSTADIQNLLKQHTITLELIAQDTQKLRREYPDSNVPDSIFQESRRTAESVYGDTLSVVDDSAFDFDGVLVNTKSYRQTLRLAQSVISSRNQAEYSDFDSQKKSENFGSTTTSNDVVSTSSLEKQSDKQRKSDSQKRKGSSKSVDLALLQFLGF